MATEKEFKLIGSFQDNITSKLQKLNREISSISKSFTKMQSKLRPIARDMGTIAMASERVAGALKNQKGAYDRNVNSMRVYRTEMGKTVAAAKKLSQIKPPKPMPTPRGGGAVPSPMAGGGGKGGGLGFLGTTGAVALGNILTQSIISGFHSGVALMMKPLQYFGNAFSERIGDEMADIQSAGGLFATDKKTGTGLFAGFEDALAMQERLNQSLAKSAAALPGATNDYVRTARQITDTVSIAFSKNQESFKKLAVQLGAAESASSEQQITKVLSSFTEKGVLLGQGQSGGIPLPILLEQLVSKEQVSVQSLKTRYQALRDNPLLASALEDAQKDINKTGAGTAERIGEVIKALDAALPVEVINKMRGSLSGLQESFRSAILDPDTGLFGLSRTLSVTTPKVDEFGRYLDKNGKVTNDVNKAVQESTSLFKVMRETFAYFLVPLAELTDALPGLFDPFTGIAEAFRDLRETGRALSLDFNSYANWFDQTAKEMANSVASLDEKDPKRIAKMAEATVLQNTKRQRSSLMAFSDMLYNTGAMTKDSYNKIVDDLTNFQTKIDEATGERIPAVNLAEISGKILKGIFNSPVMADIAGTIGEALGAAVDSIFTLLDKVIGGVEGDTGNKIIDAFVKGFQKVITPDRLAGITQTINNAVALAFKTFATTLVTVGVPLAISAIGGIFKGLEGLGFWGKLASMAIKFLLLFKVVGLATTAFAIIASIGATVAGWLGALGPALAILKAGVLSVGPMLAGVGSAIGTFVTGTLLPAITGAASAIGTFVTGTIIPAITGAASAIGTFVTGTIIPAITGAASAISTFVTGTIIPAITGAASAIGTFVTGTLLPAIGAFVTTILAPIAAIAGAIMGLVAIVRHADFIFSSLVEAVTLVFNAFQWVDVKLKELILTMIQKIFAALSNLPVIGGMFKGGSEMAGQAAADMSAKGKELEAAMQGNMAKIAENTAASWQRTQEDAAKLREMLGMGQAKAAEQNTQQIAQQTQLNAKADKTNLALDGVAKNTIQSVTKLGEVVIASNGMVTAVNGMVAFMRSGAMKVKTDSPFGALGAASAEEKAIGGTAQRFGLTKTSGFRPGDPGWHGVGRAADFSNSTGPTKEMMAFAQYLSGTIGANLKELIYTPMGYGIKNGKQVPPYAKAAHYNHVHVAWNQGNTGPLLEEMRYAGNNTLGVANSGEFIANQNQTALLANALNKQNGHTFNISVNATGDGNEVANQVAAAVLNAIRQAESSTIA